MHFKRFFSGVDNMTTHQAMDAITLALYRFAARRCASRGLRPELLCQHVRAEPVTTKRARKPPVECVRQYGHTGPCNGRPRKDCGAGVATDHIGEYGE